MLAIKDKGIVLNIIKHCNRVASKISNIDYVCFEASDDTKDIVCFNLLQIGELTRKLSNDFVSEFPDAPWKEIKGIRDRIIHGYCVIDYFIIWNTTVEIIVPLQKYCEEILESDV